MKMNKEPLFRKVNTKARGCHHDKGVNFRRERNTKNPNEAMKKDVQRGLDYTPLFKFLLSKVGQDFDTVYAEAKSRLDKNDKVDPISWMIVEDKDNQMFRNENAFFNTLFVDENNKLQKVNQNLTVSDVHADCTCCTFTFNGKVVPKKKDEPADAIL